MTEIYFKITSVTDCSMLSASENMLLKIILFALFFHEITQDRQYFAFPEARKPT